MKDKTGKLLIKDCSYPKITIQSEMLDDMCCPKITVSFAVENLSVETKESLIKKIEELKEMRCWECDIEIIFKQRDHANAKKRKKK